MMRIKSFNNAVLLILGVITLSIWSILMWSHLHGGVPSHHLLADRELPKISNWWGAILIPLTSYFLLNRIKKRVQTENHHVSMNLLKKEIYSFIASLLFAIALSISFATGNTQISAFLFLGIPVTALFFPLYRPAYILGFSLGMTYTFGGVLPVFIGCVLSIICYVLFIVINPLLIKIGKWAGVIKI